MVSGGADSACAAAALASLVGPERLHALHVNYGLRDAADDDEQTARRLCAALRIDLHVERVGREDLGPGNLQAAARAARYLAAERLRNRFGVTWIATGHTRSDVAETVVYRLAKSPGSRALLGMSPRSGRVIRPLLALSREDTRALATAAGLPFADDESNSDPGFARNRIRAEVLPALAELSPETERNIAETRAELWRGGRAPGAGGVRGARARRHRRFGDAAGRARPASVGARAAAACAALARRAGGRPPDPARPGTRRRDRPSRRRRPRAARSRSEAASARSASPASSRSASWTRSTPLPSPRRGC